MEFIGAGSSILGGLLGGAFLVLSDIVARTIQAYNNAKVPVPDSFSLPVWIDADPVMKITIEVGSQVTANYAIYKAQNK